MIQPKALRQINQHRQLRLPLLAVGSALVGASFFLLAVSLWSHGIINKATPKSKIQKFLSHHAFTEPNEEKIVGILQDLWPDDHNEEEFAASLISCVDDCLNDPPPLPKIVGLLYPPGDFGVLFVDFIHGTALAQAQHTSTEIIWEPTTHLPSPSTNDFSHLIRFVTLPLLLAAGDAVLQFATPNDITWQDIQETVPLLLHWHCELSNLVALGSAPIPLMTVTMEQIEEDALQQSFQLRNFIPNLQPNDDDGGDDTGIDPDFVDSLLYNLHEIVDRIQPLLQRLDAAFQLDSKSTPDPDLEHLVRRLIREFLIDDTKCPIDLPPMPIPSLGTAARGVYESLQTTQASNHGNPQNQDEIRCRDALLSNQRFCQQLPKAFDTKSLVEFLYEENFEQQDGPLDVREH